MNKNVLITGGAGYIGSHVCKVLKNLGYLPICYDNLSEGHKYAVKWGPLIENDLQNKKALNEVFLKYKPIAVMHFAANAIVSESMKNPEKYYKNNVISTLILLEVMKKHNIKNIVFSSTCAVYGIPKKLPISEDFEKNPINPYGRSKLMIENILKDYSNAYNFKFSILRYFNAAGADFDFEIGENHKEETHLIPLVIKSLLNKETFNIFGSDYNTEDGTAIRDYIHVMDLANVHVKSLEFLLKNNKNITLNIGTGNGYSVLEIVNAIKKYTKKRFYIKFLEKREGDPPSLFSDITKMKKFLNWQPEYSDLKTIILSAYNWHKALEKL